jgi:hypothetical protein
MKYLVLLIAFALTACATPATVVKPVPVDVVHYVKVQIPEKLIQPCTLVEPLPACWIGNVRVLCNGQVVTLLADYRAALASCDADKTALRALK